MNIKFGHIGINVKDIDISRNFYKKLFKYLGSTGEHEYRKHHGFFFDGFSVWLHQVGKAHIEDSLDGKHLGLQHLAFKVSNKNEVDEFYSGFLKSNNIKVLYGGPAEYSYVPGYYAVFFLDPNGIKLEIYWLPNTHHEG